MSDRAISILVHGLAGSGKTTLGTTAPRPLLVLDSEMAARFIRGKKIKWNPLTEVPPTYDGTWDICVVTIDDFNKAQRAYEYLKAGNHPFKSVLVDSISELQAKAVELIKGRQQLQMQDWGKLLSMMAFYCRDIRDLTETDDQIQAVVVTATSKDYDGIIKPYLQGQIASQVPYWMDITAYMYVTQEADENGEVRDVRNLLIGNHPNYEAKSRVPDLPPVISNPNVAEMLNVIFGPEEVGEVEAAPKQFELPETPAQQAPQSNGAPEAPPL